MKIINYLKETLCNRCKRGRLRESEGELKCTNCENRAVISGTVILFLFLFLPVLSFAQGTTSILQVKTVKPSGAPDSTKVTIYRADKTGYLFTTTKQEYFTSKAAGIAHIPVLRTSPTDTSYYGVVGNFGPFVNGKVIVILDADTTYLSSYVSAPPFNTTAITYGSTATSLSPSGTLGQVWKMLAGGTQGWGTDATGAGGTDTTAIYNEPHTWTGEQYFRRPLRLQDTLAAGSGLHRLWYHKMEDSSASLYGAWVGNYGWSNGGVGRENYNDQVFDIGYNMNAENVHDNSFGFQFESEYFVSQHPHSEFHLVGNGRNGDSHRGLSFATRKGDGRWTSGAIAIDRILIGNSSSGSNLDSMALDILNPINGGVGAVRLNNAYLDYQYGNSLFTLARVQSDTSTVAMKSVLDWNNGVLTHGAVGLVTEAHRPKQVQLYAGPAGLYAERYNNRLTLDARVVKRSSSPFGVDKDTLELSTKGMLETRLATKLNTTTLTDSLSANTVRAESDPTATAKAQVVVTDTLNKFPRGWLNRDTVAIGPTLDGMYARSGGAGGGVSTDSLVTWPFYRAENGKQIRPKIVGGSDTQIGDTIAVDGELVFGTIGAGLTTRAHIRNPGSSITINALGALDVYTFSNTMGTRLFNYNPTASSDRDPGGSVLQIDKSYGSTIFNMLASANTIIGGLKPGFKLDVQGSGRFTDTLWVAANGLGSGSWIKPGDGSWTVISDSAKKNNITQKSYGAGLFERFLSVPVVTFNYKPEIFKQNPKLASIPDSIYDEATKKYIKLTPAQRNARLAQAITDDNAQANLKASEVRTGFIAQQLNRAGFGASSTTRNNDELIATLWAVNQEIIRKVQELERRIEKLEKK